MLSANRPPQIWKSLLSYIPAVARYWWAIVIGGIAGAVRLFQEIEPGMNIPTWLWLGAFFVGTSAAQFMAWHRLRMERDRLRQFNVTQDALTKLGQYRAQLVDRQNVIIGNDVDLGRWIADFEALKREITAFIRSSVSPAEASYFETYGIFVQHLLGNEINQEHVKYRSMIIRDHQHLGQLISDYSRKYSRDLPSA